MNNFFFLSCTNKKAKKSLKDYELVNVANKKTPDLGKGAFGSVRLVKDKSDDKLYIKI